MSTTYKLTPPPAAAARVPLDAHQQRVVDHNAGPLLVLAGPGTGKTTTLVEAVATRIEQGADPSSVLALTFSRKAAEQLRDRVTGRLGRTLASPIASTFHSFAYGLVRQFAPAEIYAAPLRLLSAPEADVLIRELLEQHAESVRWPEPLHAAARTRGFAREVATVLARAREKGADHEQLVALGAAENIPEFVAAGLFLHQYLNALDYGAVTDYPDLIRRAVIEAELHREELRRRFEHVFVDEYQDTDPGQVALLQALAGDGRNLVVVGDPHQSIYGFRGADVRGILDFPRVFPTASGAPAPVEVLQTTRRFGAQLAAASQAIARRLPLHGGIGAEAIRAFSSVSVPEEAPDGVVECYTYDSERAEIERIADLLRRAHLEDGVPWSDMAILVRSGRAMLPVLRRALPGAGVPVDVGTDEIPLADEPAVVPLLMAVDVVARSESEAPTSVELSDIESLLLSPLGGFDAAELRTLGRVLRHADQRMAVAEGRVTRGSRELVRQAILRPELLIALLEEPAVAKASQLAQLIATCRGLLDEGATVEEVLWQLWAGTGWSRRLRVAIERGGSVARRAHRDLDALLALFEIAAKAEEKQGHTSVASFLAQLRAQQIPGDTLADKGVSGDSVRLLTAHRSKGLEWPLVVVAHAQEGSWPDLRRRTSLLQADRIGADSYGEILIAPDVTARELLAEERRLFYVAMTRARHRLILTAVSSTADDGEQPSRFLDETELVAVHQSSRPERALTLPSVVAQLRRTLTDPAASEALKAAAATRLASLAEHRVNDRRVAPLADPDRWWGISGWTHSAQPVRPEAEPVRLSASAVTDLLQCPARWFLQREAGGASFSNQAAGFGNLVHKIAEHVASSDLGDAEIDDLMVLVDQVWDQLPFRTPWSRAKEYVEIRAAIERFLVHHRRADANAVLATEQQLDALVTLPDGVTVRLHGFADRVEITADGRVVIVDLKTGKAPFPAGKLAEHPQLGIYQLAVNNGAVDDLVDGGAATAAGAELWQLRLADRNGPKVQPQQPQQREEGDGWLTSELQVAEAARIIRSEEFPALPGTHCRYCLFTGLCPSQNTAAVLQ